MAVEVAKAFVSIIPSLDGANGAIERGFSEAVGGSSIATTLGNALASAVDRAFSAVRDHISGGIERLDVIENYPLVMESLGYKTEEARESIDKIAERLDGLPSSTDAVVNSVQKLAASMGGKNLDRATDFGLALNDMLLGGGKSQMLVGNALEQMNQMIGVGKVDMMAWRSVVNAAPGQVDMLSKALLGAEATSMDLYNALGGNKNEQIISFDELIDKIIELDQAGEAGFAGWNEQAYAATGGIGVAITNVDNRLNKMWENILRAIGRDKISGAINAVSSKFPAIGRQVGDVIDMLQGEIRLEDGPFAWLQPLGDTLQVAREALGLCNEEAAGLGGEIEAALEPAHELWETGDEVAALQERLMEAGFDVGSYGIDGVFGPETQAALEAYNASVEEAAANTAEVVEHPDMPDLREFLEGVPKLAEATLADVHDRVSGIAEGSQTAAAAAKRVLKPIARIGKVLKSSAFTNMRRFLSGEIDSARFFDNVWTSLKGGAGQAFRGVVSNLTAEISNADWRGIGGKAGDLLVGGLGGIGGAVLGILGISDAVRSDIDGSGIGEVLLGAIGDAFAGIGDSVVAWIDGVDWADVGSRIGGWIAGKLQFATDVTETFRSWLENDVRWDGEDGIGATLGGKLAGAFTLVGGGISEKVGAWVDENGGWEAAAQAAGDLFAGAFSLVGGGAGLRSLAVKAAAWIGKVPWGALAGGAGALFTVGWAFTSPIGQDIVDKAINWILGDDGSTWKEASERAGGEFAGAFGFIGYEAGKIGDKADEWVVGQGGWEGLGEKAGEKVGGAFKFVGDLASKAYDWFAGVDWGGKLDEAVGAGGSISGFGAGFIGAIEGAVDWDDLADRMWYHIGGGVLAFLDGGWPMVRDSIPKLFGLVGETADGSYKDVGEGIGGAVRDGIAGFVGFNKDVGDEILDKVFGRGEDGSIPDAEGVGRDIGAEIYNGLKSAMADLFVSPLMFANGLIGASVFGGQDFYMEASEELYGDNPWYQLGADIGSGIRQGFWDSVSGLFYDFATELSKAAAGVAAGTMFQEMIFGPGWEESYRLAGFSEEQIAAVGEVLNGTAAEKAAGKAQQVVDATVDDLEELKGMYGDVVDSVYDDAGYIMATFDNGMMARFRSADGEQGQKNPLDAEIAPYTPMVEVYDPETDPDILRVTGELEYDYRDFGDIKAEEEEAERAAELSAMYIDALSGATTTGSAYDPINAISDAGYLVADTVPEVNDNLAGALRDTEKVLTSSYDDVRKAADTIRVGTLAGVESLPAQLANVTSEAGDRANRATLGGARLVEGTVGNFVNDTVSRTAVLPPTMEEHGTQGGEGFASGVGSQTDAAVRAASGLRSGAEGELGGLRDPWFGLGSSGVSGWLAGISSHVSETIGAAEEHYNGVVNALRGTTLYEKLFGEGRTGSSGWAGGIADKAGEALEAGAALAESAYDKVKEAIPWFKTSGSDSGGGYASGIKGQFDKAGEEAGKVGRNAADAIAKHSASFKTSGSTSGSNYNAGLKGLLGSSATNGKALAQKAYDKVKAAIPWFKKSGSTSGSNYNAGLKGWSGSSATNGKALAQKAYDKVKAYLSPFKKSGSTSGSNYNAGLKGWSKAVATTGTTLRDKAYNPVKNSVKWFKDRGSDAGDNLNKGLKGRFSTVGATGTTLRDKAYNPVKGLSGLGKDPGSAMVDNVVSGMGSKWEDLNTAAWTIRSTASDPAVGIKDIGWDGGSGFVQNIIDGINSKIEELRKTANKASDVVARLWGHSVPKEGPLSHDDEWGGHMVDNFTGGMKSRFGELRRTSEEAAKAASFTGFADMDGSDWLNAGGEVNVYIDGARVNDDDGMRRAVYEVVTEAYRRRH